MPPLGQNSKLGRGIGRVITRSISAENPSGAKSGARMTEGTGSGAAADLGTGWKVSPSVEIGAESNQVLADISEAGTITHIWLTTHPDNWRSLILRMYWDGSDEPAVEVPVGDFFCQGWGRFAQVNSSRIAVNPHGGFNSYWPMPFAKGARIELENLREIPVIVYYQVDYEVGEPDETAYFHAQWRRSRPVQDGVHTLVEGIEAAGQYVGTYFAWGVNSTGWWGEGEMKFFLDGDQEYPTICGTGTEDYFGGAWNFDVPGQGYTEFSTPYLGMPQVIRPDGLYSSQQRFGLYRWHELDPIHFNHDLRVTCQALGWRYGGKYQKLLDDVASTTYLYLDRPSVARPPVPTPDELEWF